MAYFFANIRHPFSKLAPSLWWAENRNEVVKTQMNVSITRHYSDKVQVLRNYQSDLTWLVLCLIDGNTGVACIVFHAYLLTGLLKGGC